MGAVVLIGALPGCASSHVDQGSDNFAGSAAPLRISGRSDLGQGAVFVLAEYAAKPGQLFCNSIDTGDALSFEVAVSPSKDENGEYEFEVPSVPSSPKMRFGCQYGLSSAALMTRAPAGAQTNFSFDNQFVETAFVVYPDKAVVRKNASPPTVRGTLTGVQCSASASQPAVWSCVPEVDRQPQANLPRAIVQMPPNADELSVPIRKN
jgi:hypothetical protein